MNDILTKTLDKIDDIINNSDAKNIDFYEQILKIMSSLYSNDYSLGIYFCEDVDYSLKIAIKENEIIKENISISNENLDLILNSKKKCIEIDFINDKFFDKNVIFSKLQIKESVFGFCFLSSKNKLSDEIKASFASLVGILSYKIKDHELNEVFKIQLKAMQDAILEKDSAYEVIKKQHKKLQELDKMKNLFLANISHELRTPLNAIIGFSQALDSQIFGELNEKQAEYIKDIQISSLHLLGMINEILDISKLEANAMKFNPTNLSPNQVIQEVVNILEPLYKNKKIEILFNPNFNCEIKADYQKFQQILYNLLSNAIKFTPEKGLIQISCDVNKKDFVLQVKDNGIGIDKKYHNKIFKKFVHLNNVYAKQQNSTGLGLTITKELVKLHNGKITVESEVGKGTTFVMKFSGIVL